MHADVDQDAWMSVGDPKRKTVDLLHTASQNVGNWNMLIRGPRAAEGWPLL